LPPEATTGAFKFYVFIWFYNKKQNYRAFHGFGQATFPDGGLVLGSSQFSILPQLPLKTLVSLKGVKN